MKDEQGLAVFAVFAVSLKDLRSEGACYGGYNRVVRSLQGREFSEEDQRRLSYIRYKHDDLIPVVKIIESNGLEDALWALRCVKGADRDMRLYAVWCARQVQYLMADTRSVAALEVAERFACGNASESELDAARDAAWAAARDAASAAARAAARAAAWDAASAAARDAAWAASADTSAASADTSAATWAAAWAAASAAQKEMLIKMCNGEAPWQVTQCY